ncbi:MAG: hypothetical protein HIU85_19655 [Proteobacteria bacterium]|nr:hypothetical protein [Pseudomonadota bacterium]
MAGRERVDGDKWQKAMEVLVKDAEARPPQNRVTLREAVQSAAPAIRRLRRLGRGWAEIASSLQAQGFSISALTLERYSRSGRARSVRSVRRAKGGSEEATSRSADPAQTHGELFARRLAD